VNQTHDLQLVAQWHQQGQSTVLYVHVVDQGAIDADLFVYSLLNAGYIAVNARMGNELKKMKKVTIVPKWGAKP